MSIPQVAEVLVGGKPVRFFWCWSCMELSAFIGDPGRLAVRFAEDGHVGWRVFQAVGSELDVQTVVAAAAQVWPDRETWEHQSRSGRRWKCHERDVPFLNAIKAAPSDDTTRLVYADWLEEHDRPGSEFLRIECQLSALDPADDKRIMLLARLRLASKGLDEEWMAAVSRESVEDITVREREIRRWLRRRVTVAEMLAGWDRPPSPRKGLRDRIRGLFKRAPEAAPQPPSEGPTVRWLREWIEANMRPGDELWEYNTGGDSWENLCGEMGSALVRAGRVVEFKMLANN
jgi:uncharacterized protein (TIGR02996 family)